MQKSYQYVRICIHVNLFSLFLDIMSYLIMVTSVEEESSFPLPTQNPVQGSFGGDHTLWSLRGRGRTPTGISVAAAWLLLSPVAGYSSLVPLRRGADPQTEPILELQTHCPQVSVFPAQAE